VGVFLISFSTSLLAEAILTLFLIGHAACASRDYLLEMEVLPILVVQSQVSLAFRVWSCKKVLVWLIEHSSSMMLVAFDQPSDWPVGLLE